MRAALDIARFTDRGLAAFGGYLESLRKGEGGPPPQSLLTDPGMSAPLGLDRQVAPIRFETRLDFARYVDILLHDWSEETREGDVFLWSWLSLFYFDQVCPLEPTGIRKPGRDYRHILQPGYPTGHRHLLGGAYLVYTVYGLGEELSGLLLHTPLPVESKYHHELAGRQTFITNRGIMEAAHRLYFNPATRKPKPGTLVRRDAPGTLLRFVHVVQQLDLTYDLYSMTGEQVLYLLPPEFDRWKQGPGNG